jgi:hypothetical protein
VTQPSRCGVGVLRYSFHLHYPSVHTSAPISIWWSCKAILNVVQANALPLLANYSYVVILDH